ncbi:Glutamate racemase [Lentibacillus sp. JNUCC-1]|nr:Glutamate racemase [Lentibacillus sp. JNUCC-1]
MTDFLIKQDIKMLVIACNTATAFTLEVLQNELSIPVLGVIQPGARAAIKAAKTNHVAVIGTQGTIMSGAYAEALRTIKPLIDVYQLACPQFVPLVETGMMTGEYTEDVVRTSLQPLKLNGPIDTLILGCTHYPLLKHTIRKVMGPNISIISSSEETARETSVLLSLNQMLNNSKNPVKHEFYTTGDTGIFAGLVRIIFESTENRVPLIPTIKQVSID